MKELSDHLKRTQISAFILIGMIILLTLGAVACTRPLRQDGLKVAEVGSATSRQMAEYYELLQKDALNTYEMNAFREAYLTQKVYEAEVKRINEAYKVAIEEAKRKGTTPPPPPTLPPAPKLGLDEKDKALLDEYRKTYQALETRIQLANAMKNAYDSFINLNQYDAAAEAQKNVEALSSTVTTVIGTSFPGPAGSFIGDVTGALLKDVVGELRTISQNKKILTSNNDLAVVLEKLTMFFEKEKILYGGDEEIKTPEGKLIEVSGIAGRRSAAYKSVAQELVESEVVITTTMVSRVLGQYDFRWPEPQMPFTQNALKSGIIKIIEARSFPIVKITKDTGEKISKSLTNLSMLHRQLAEKKPLSLQEALENSATAQALLNQLKKTKIPIDFPQEFLENFSK